MLEHLYQVHSPHTFFGTSGGRTMGLTVPAMLGARMASNRHSGGGGGGGGGSSSNTVLPPAPAPKMVGIAGDGSTLMRLGELEVFGRQWQADPGSMAGGTALVIINDGALGTMRSRQRARGMEEYGLTFLQQQGQQGAGREERPGIDFAAVAEACGMAGRTVTTPQELDAALAYALCAPSAPPTVIDARVDPRAYQDSFGPTIGVPLA
jgi:thiamine pyrophosphate-dependent acetolactate synthase large subunit-like protein